MILFINREAIESTNGWHLLLDNDFLSELFKNDTVLTDFVHTFSKTYFILDPLTEFEFLRDIYEPQQRILKEAFIDQPIFLPVPNHQEIFLKLQENAMLLSRIYSHKGHTKNTKISLVDLFLGARCMLNATTLLAVTGNKKDFPTSIFDTIGVMNIEQNDGQMKPYSIVKFNKSKFDTCIEDIQKMEHKPRHTKED